MRRSYILLLAAALVAAGALVWLYVPALAAGASVVGKWQVTLFPPDGSEMTLWLVEIEDKDGKHSGKVLSAGDDNLKNTKVDQIKADDKALHLTMKVEGQGGALEIPITVYLPEGERVPKVLRGFIELRGQKLFAQMERSELKELDPEKAIDKGAMPTLRQVMRTKDAKDKAKLYRDVIKDYADRPAAFLAGVGLLDVMAKDGASAEELRKEAAAALKVAAAFGPELKQIALVDIARPLNATEQSAPVAVEYARQAERGLANTDPPAATLPILKILALGLRKSGKTDEAKEVQARVDKLEDVLDEEFLKDAVPFKPKAFAGRKSDSKRVVVVELFTGAQCPPCVAADVAFDALDKTYKASEVVLLQYHLHVPGPDPLTNEDSEKRAEFYEVEGTPTFYLDGKTGPGVGGPKQASKEAYAEVQKKIAEALEDDAKAGLKLTAARQGDKINIAADVSGIEKPGEKVRLRFVLLEDVVRYPGRNGQRLHHHVVRSFPGGVEGKKLTNAASKHEVSVSVAELAKSLDAYLATGKRTFAEDERPLNLKDLKVVAFIQDDENKKILQAAQADLGKAE
jgi:hypothetical protein